MTFKKIKSFAICLLVALAAMMGVFTLNLASASGSNFSMQNGASIRIRNTDNTYGIQFFANVDTSVDATYNLMILPETYVDYYEADATQNKAPLAEWMLAKKAAHPEMPLAIVENLKPDQDGVIKGSIVNVLYQNLNTKFIGAAYYEVDGEPVCADLATDDGRTVVEVAELAIADPENVDFVTDLQGIVKDGIHQANGKEQGTVEAVAIALNKTTANMYIGEQLELSYTPAIATSLANWSVEGDAVTVENGKVTAVKAGTATVSVSVVGATASCTVTVDAVRIQNSKNTVYTKTGENKGEITLANTNEADGWAAATVNLVSQFTNQFVKVGYKLPTTSIETRKGGIAIGLRQEVASCDCLTGWTIFHPEFAGGVYLNKEWHSVLAYSKIDDSSKSAVGNPIIRQDISLLSGLSTEKTYYEVAGVLGEGQEATVYWALLDQDDTILRLYSFNVGKVSGINGNALSMPASGYISIFSTATDSRTLTYEIIDGEEFVLNYASSEKVDISETAKNAIKWDKLNWAEGYKIQVNGGEWTDLGNENTYSVDNTGIYSINVKAYKGEKESAVANCTVTNIEDDIALVGLGNVSSTELSHEKGSISFTTSGVARTGAGLISLKKQYANEFIKIGFTVPEGGGLHNTKFAVGMRSTNSTGVDHIRGEIYYNSYNNGSDTYVLTGYSDKYFYSDHGGGKHETNVYKASSAPKFKDLSANEKYYIAVGIITEEDSSFSYFVLMDKNENVLRIISWDLASVLKTAGAKYTIPEGGYFNIYCWAASTTLDYEIVSAESILDTVGVQNAANGSASVENDITTYKVTANEGATYRNAAYMSDQKIHFNKFAKVGFIGVAGKFKAQQLSFGMRCELSKDSASAKGLFVNPSEYGQGVVLWGGSANNHVQNTGKGKIVYGTWSNSYAEGKQYYAYFGAVGAYAAATDTTELVDAYYYFAIAEEIEGEEVLKFVVRWTHSENNCSVRNYGSLAVWSWATTEKTITYQIVDNSTILDKITA